MDLAVAPRRGTRGVLLLRLGAGLMLPPEAHGELSNQVKTRAPNRQADGRRRRRRLKVHDATQILGFGGAHYLRRSRHILNRQTHGLEEGDLPV